MRHFLWRKSGTESMKSKRTIIHYSLFASILAAMPIASNAAMRVGNHSRSYAEAYQQVNAMRNAAPTDVQQTQTIVTTPSTDTENNLPVRVADDDLAQQIATSGTDSVAFNQLEQCSMIYPNGEFAWDNPTLGNGAGGADTCVAVVELRGYQAAPDGSDLVLARATLAAGDVMNCNISEFPEATMNVSAVESFVFPADSAPTMDDVVAQMNQEQKQNAGLKIAAGALIGGLGGNMAGANDRGNDSLLGTDKGKVQGTVIGALSGAALMAGNSYAGKVAGDTILSTGVNAAAGSIIGNMSGTGDSVLRIEDCELDGKQESCLWGALVIGQAFTGTAFYEIRTGATYVCDNNMQNCKQTDLVSIKLRAYPNNNVDDIDASDLQQTVLNDASLQYYIASSGGNDSFVSASGANTDSDVAIDADRGLFTPVASAKTIDRQIPAMIKMRDKAFGMSSADWREWKRNNNSGITIYGRTSSGDAYPLPEGTDADVQNFYPMKVNAEDGSLIDFGNKARLKSTLIGAGVGGALGGFAGYQGAQTDIQNRWVTAVREYEDSLTKVYCATGNRYLSGYNDTVFIPAMTVTTTE